MLVGSIKGGSFNFVSAAYRKLAAAGTLEEELLALSADVGFHVGDITLSSFFEFLVAPTLMYQAAYHAGHAVQPVAPRVRGGHDQ